MPVSLDGCSPSWGGVVHLPIESHNIGPWVRIIFDDGAGTMITVGNESCPAYDNNAVITSFTYGFSGGSTNGADGVSVEIIDQEGSEFSNFMIKTLPKSREKGAPAANCTMLFEFGWTQTSNPNKCQSGALVDCCTKSKRRKVFPLKVDIAFHGGGVIKYTIHAAHPVEAVAEGTNADRETFKISEPDPGTYLKESIKRLMTDIHGIEVRFLKGQLSGPSCGGGDCAPGGAYTDCLNMVDIVPAGGYLEWKFYKETDDPCKGQKYPWTTNNKNPIQAVMEWLQNKATLNEPPRGFVVGTCNTTKTVCFWESPLPDCKGQSAMRHIGTFIVNGGKCSPVLEFKPQISWHVANANYGGTPATETSGHNQPVTAKTFPDITCEISGEGTKEITQVPEYNTRAHPSDAAEFTAECHAANARALPPAMPVSAELVVQGNPVFDDPMQLSAGYEMGIVVVNPFILTDKGSFSDDCPDWLADPPINQFLSNKHWMVRGVNHQIKEGSFTTTFQVWLATPGVTINRKAELGGPGGPQLYKT